MYPNLGRKNTSIINEVINKVINEAITAGNETKNMQKTTKLHRIDTDASPNDDEYWFLIVDHKLCEENELIPKLSRLSKIGRHKTLGGHDGCTQDFSEQISYDVDLYGVIAKTASDAKSTIQEYIIAQSSEHIKYDKIFGNVCFKTEVRIIKMTREDAIKCIEAWVGLGIDERSFNIDADTAEANKAFKILGLDEVQL